MLPGMADTGKREDITLADYERLVTAFTHHPGKSAYVARLTGLTRQLAWKGWAKGWKTLGLPPIAEKLGHPPVQPRPRPPPVQPRPRPPPEPPEVIAQRAVADAALTAEGAALRLVEDATARAVLEATAEEAARAAKERARREAREAREQAQARADNRDNAAVVLETERKLRAGVRQVAGQNLVASTKWGPALILLAEELVDRIEKMRKSLPLADLLDIGKALSQIDRARAFLVRESAELERLHRGDPLLTVGITPNQPMSLADCTMELRQGERLLRRLEQKARGIIAGDPVDAAAEQGKPLH